MSQHLMQQSAEVSADVQAAPASAAGKGQPRVLAAAQKRCSDTDMREGSCCTAVHWYCWCKFASSQAANLQW